MASAARLPGDNRVGDAVFYTAASETRPNGARLYGGDGEIVGPATSETHKENAVAVKFSANADVNCGYLTQLGRSPPPATLPGDYRVGDAVFFAAPNEKLSNGERVLYGEEGEIKGPAHWESRKEGLAVKFSANAGLVSCYLTTLSRTPPPTMLPGGYRVGDTVIYAAPSQKLSNGDRVLYGEEGEIVGPATSDDCVAVKFTANAGRVNCYLTQLGRTPLSMSFVETEANIATRDQAFEDAKERAEKAASELLASETVEADMKNVRRANKKQKNIKKKNRNRQNSSTHAATRSEPTGEAVSGIEAKPREDEAVKARESAEPEPEPAAAPIPRPGIIPASLPAPPRPPGAAASPVPPPPPRSKSTIKLSVTRPIELAPATLVATSLYRVDGALSAMVAATAGADGGDDDDDDAIEWTTSGDGHGHSDASGDEANSCDNKNEGLDKSEETKMAALRDLLLEDLMTCPITLECFVDPVITPGGVTYERKAIVEHILLRGCDPLDPARVLTEFDLQPNIVVRNICARCRTGQI